MQKITDTHTHLYSKEFASDLPQLMEQADAMGVGMFFMPNIDSSSIGPMLEVEARFPGKCFSMMGLHPCSVKDNFNSEMAVVEQWLEKRSFAAVGEMGIDLYWDKAFLDQQKEVFLRQVELANHYKLPVVIHTRESFDVAVELLRQVKKEPPCGVFHCFTGNADQAKMVIDMGFFLGIGGVATFKNSGLDKTLADVGIEHLVLETDAPYLAPVPYRGKRNEPAYILKVAEKLSEIKNISLEKVAEITSDNAQKVFGLTS